MGASVDALKVRIFADGADLAGILELAKNPAIQGFTTNPSLMRQAGITDYAGFAQELLGHIKDRPISFEVFADEFDEMEVQAKAIAAWGPNVYVKIPVTNTRGDSSGPLIQRLSKAGVKLNVTAVFTVDQVWAVSEMLDSDTPAIVSVFAGRVADTGVDPVPVMSECLDVLRPWKNCELLWASPREIINIFQADEIGCHIITVTHATLQKLALIGKDLTGYSLETVTDFHRDAVSAGYAIEVPKEEVA